MAVVTKLDTVRASNPVRRKPNWTWKRRALTKWGGRSLNVIEEIFCAGRQNWNCTRLTGRESLPASKLVFLALFCITNGIFLNFFLHQVWNGRTCFTGSRRKLNMKRTSSVIIWSVLLTFSSQQGTKSSSRNFKAPTQSSDASPLLLWWRSLSAVPATRWRRAPHAQWRRKMRNWRGTSR